MAAPASPAHSDLMSAALGFAASRMAVFPCVPGGKAPITARGFRDATTDETRIRAWWTASPTANMATPTGRPGFDALDVDVRADGSGWAGLHRARAAGLLDGWIRAVRTPSGGLHLHYPGTEQRNGCMRGQHLDFRGLGGYVLLPPSLIRTSAACRRYEVIASRADPGKPLDWPGVTRLLAPAPATGHRAHCLAKPSTDLLPRLAAHVARQVEGNRDNALFWAACRAAESGIRDATPLIEAAVSAGLPERQARRTVRSAQAIMASRLVSTSAAVVDQLQTLMRIARRPCQTVPPHQQVPSRWISSITRAVDSSSPKETSTWFSTTSLRIS